MTNGERPKTTLRGRSGGIPVAVDVFVRYVCPRCGNETDYSDFMLHHVVMEHPELVRGENSQHGE